MNLHLFFEGTMAREPISSAFLATLLDQCNEVRNYFFDRLADCVGQELAEFKKRQWTICVERYAVDIRLDSLDGEWVILLENKLQRVRFNGDNWRGITLSRSIGNPLGASLLYS